MSCMLPPQVCPHSAHHATPRRRLRLYGNYLYHLVWSADLIDAILQPDENVVGTPPIDDGDGRGATTGTTAVPGPLPAAAAPDVAPAPTAAARGVSGSASAGTAVGAGTRAGVKPSVAATGGRVPRARL